MEQVEGALALLSHWPAELRTAPPLWIKRWLAGESDLRLHLAAQFEVIGESLPDGGATLLSSPLLSSLRDLVVYTDDFDARGLDALLQAPHGGQINTLFVDSESLDSAFIDVLVDRAPTQLQGLVLLGGNIGDAGAIRLAECTKLTQLTQLHLHDTGVHKVGACALADSPHLHPLVRLEWKRLIEEGTFPIPACQTFA